MRQELLTEGVLAKFLRYVQINTESDETLAGVPSTPGQWELAHMLAAELTALGLQNISVDEHAIVTASLPGVPTAPTIGLLAHIDTSSAVSGRGVKPLVHTNFSGSVTLPNGLLVDTESQPALNRVLGHTIVTSDGTTLLGADDKAGVAEIMEALCTLIRKPELKHAPVRVAFTPDEEIGRGIRKLDTTTFAANIAYTLDGGELGELHGENFNALNLKITFTGRSAHTGSARGIMVNALTLAAGFISVIPASMRPETTSGRDGFVHIDALTGTVENAEAVVLLRDFTISGLEAKEAMVDKWCGYIQTAYPGSQVTVERMRGYQNMKNTVNQDTRVMTYLRQAMSAVGVQPLERSIRGGTDGADLSARGLPTPNFFVGGGGFHSRTEWVSVQWMEKAVDVAVKLTELWGDAKRGAK